MDSRRHIASHIIIILPKPKDKERIFKTAREKKTVTSKGVPIGLLPSEEEGRDWVMLLQALVHPLCQPVTRREA